MKRVIGTLLSFLLAMLASTAAHALPFGYFLGGSGSPAAAITASGHTATQLNDLTAADLTGISVLWILNGDNGAPPTALVNNAAAIANFVQSGGVLSYHDRYVSDGNAGSTNNAVLPGASGISFIRDFTDDANIEVLANNLVTNGPGGVITNTSLDGGTSSSHGYVTLASVPLGGTAVLSRSAADEIVDFYYGFGAGWVYYSTMPLDYYLGGSGPNPPRDNFNNIYAVNEAAFQASLARTDVPEPGTLAMLGLGLVGIAARRRRQAA